MTVQDNSIEFSYAYFTPKSEGTEGNVNKDKNVKKNAEHWLVKRIAKPSLRNIGYTICVLFQCAWILYVFIYMVKLLVEGPKSPCQSPDDDECHVASFANHVMEQVVKISVPLFFFIPPLLPHLIWRTNVYLGLTIFSAVTLLGYVISSVYLFSLCMEIKLLSFFNVNMMEIVTSLVLVVCVLYLGYRRDYIFGFVVERQLEAQSAELGRIYTVELLVVTGTGIVAAMEGDYEHTLTSACSDTLAQHTDLYTLSTKPTLAGLQTFHPWYFISFILLVQIK